MNSALLHGLPVALVVLVIALIYSRAGSRMAPYKLSQPWTHEPILWSAVEESLPAEHPHGGSAFSVGGGASGRW